MFAEAIKTHVAPVAGAAAVQAAGLAYRGVKALVTREVEVVRQVPRFFFTGLTKRVIQTEVQPHWPRLAVAAGAAACYAAYRSRVTSKRLRVYRDDAMCEAESIIPGSALLEGGRPLRCQVRVAMRTPKGLMVVGGGVRVLNFLLMPTHNSHVGYDTYIINGADDSRMVKLDPTKELIIAPDVSAFPLTESQWADLQVPQAKLAPLAHKSRVTCVSAVDAKYSVGSITVGSTIGRVVYDASTMPGFSGSIYSNGTHALGMHTHGGQLGGGYELLYLYVRLKAALDQVDEGFWKKNPDGSYSWIDEEEPDFTERLGSGDDDKVVVRSKSGTYILALNKDWTAAVAERAAKAKKTGDWAEDTDYLDDIPYDPYVAESGPGLPLMRTAFPGEGQRPAALKRTAGPVPPPETSSAHRTVSQSSKGDQHFRDANALWSLIGKLSEKQLGGLIRSAQEMASTQQSKRRSRSLDQLTHLPRPSGIASSCNSVVQPKRGG
nr:hypothetical protein 1 [Virus sp.]